MSKLPTPSWLTFPETIAWLAERGISEDEAKSNLPRAFRDYRVQIRGRRGGGIELLQRIDWSRAIVSWEDSSLRIPGRFKQMESAIREIEVSRDHLSRWIGEEEGDQSEILSPKNSGGRPPKYEWEVFWINVTKIANTPDGLPEQQGALVKIMLDWCGKNWTDPPSETSVKNRVRQLYSALNTKAET